MLLYYHINIWVSDLFDKSDTTYYFIKPTDSALGVGQGYSLIMDILSSLLRTTLYGFSKCINTNKLIDSYMCYSPGLGSPLLNS